MDSIRPGCCGGPRPKAGSTYVREHRREEDGNPEAGNRKKIVSRAEVHRQHRNAHLLHEPHERLRPSAAKRRAGQGQPASVLAAAEHLHQLRVPGGRAHPGGGLRGQREDPREQPVLRDARVQVQRHCQQDLPDSIRAFWKNTKTAGFGNQQIDARSGERTRGRLIRNEAVHNRPGDEGVADHRGKEHRAGGEGQQWGESGDLDLHGIHGRRGPVGVAAGGNGNQVHEETAIIIECHMIIHTDKSIDKLYKTTTPFTLPQTIIFDS